MSPGQTRPGPRPLSENRLDHHRPPLSACLPAYIQKKGSGFDFWQSSKPAEIIGK